MSVRSKLSQTGFLMVDNRLSGGVLFEADTRQCAHCQRGIILHPHRIRARNHCKTCDEYICDSPECHYECVPIKKVFDDALEARAKGHPLILPKRFTS